jgi:two-component system response regulator NreC
MVLRSGLKLMLNAQTDMEVVGEAGEGQETLELLPCLQPDVLLLDLSMPGLDGLQVLETVRVHYPQPKVLVLTMYDDEEYVKKVLSLGASGYILKRAADVELLAAIRTVFKGGIFVDQALSGILVRQAFPAPEQKQQKEREETLSEREWEVLQLVAMGYTNRQIAEKLVISIKTVESHKAHVKEKLGVKGRSELVRYAMQHGLSPSGIVNKLP